MKLNFHIEKVRGQKFLVTGHLHCPIDDEQPETISNAKQMLTDRVKEVQAQGGTYHW